jgi:hypothetical protein
MLRYLLSPKPTRTSGISSRLLIIYMGLLLKSGLTNALLTAVFTLLGVECSTQDLFLF